MKIITEEEETNLGLLGARGGAADWEINPLGLAVVFMRLQTEAAGTFAAGLATGPTSGWAIGRQRSCWASTSLSGRSEETWLTELENI